jgi:tRNA (cmo5U34)-methyltransferase
MFGSDNATPHYADSYDMQVRNTLPYYDSFHEQTINLIKTMHLNPKLWLDTGCGTGTMVQKAITAFPDTHFVLADPSEKMLEIAKNKFACSNVEFLNAATTQNIEWQSAAFDIITAIQSHHYQSPQGRTEATAACFKMLIPKGVYVTFENIKPMTQEGIVIGKELWKQFQLSRGRDLTTTESHMKRFGVEYQPITLEEHLDLLRKTGFSVVELLWYSVMQGGFYCVK